MKDENITMIQLPPLPIDINLAELCVMWIYAALPVDERVKALEGMHSIIERERIEAMECGEQWKETPFSVDDFSVFMNRLTGNITSGACDLAGLVYRKRFIEGLSLEELIQEVGSDHCIIKAISEYYDIRMEEEKKKYS